MGWTSLITSVCRASQKVPLTYLCRPSSLTSFPIEVPYGDWTKPDVSFGLIPWQLLPSAVGLRGLDCATPVKPASSDGDGCPRGLGACVVGGCSLPARRRSGRLTVLPEATERGGVGGAGAARVLSL